MIMLILASSLPKALVAIQVNRAESLRSVRLIDRLDMTPSGRISSLKIVSRPPVNQLFKFLKPCNLPNGVAIVRLRVQSNVVHVPQNADRFLALGFALQYRRFASSGRLVS